MNFKQNIKQILREGIAPVAPEAAVNINNSKGNTMSEGDVEVEEASDEDYVEITNKLMKTDIINHSAVMRRMKGIGNWGQADDNERGLFEKKLKRNKNDGVGTYRFTRQEAQKIKDILNDPYKSSKKEKKRA